MEKNSSSQVKTKQAEVEAVFKANASVFSEGLLEVEPEVFFENPWHIRIVYGILDNILVQNQKTGKIEFNKGEGRINRRVVIVIPRNHAKSTSASVNWPLKEIYRDNNIRIVIASNTASQSSSFLREVKSHIEGGEKLKEIMGSLKPQIPEKWTDREIIVKRTSKKKDPTISTTGTGGAVLSKRADVVIFDDLLDPEKARTPEQRANTDFWVNNVMRPVIEPKTGRQFAIGTLWYKGDYLDERLKDHTFDVRLQLRALIKDSKTGEGSDHEYAMDIREVFDEEVINHYGINAKEGVLWPERWPLSELMNEKESIGSVAFNRQYMNVIISEEDQIIKTEWLENAKVAGAKYKFLKSYNVATSPYGALRIAQGWDLAISESARADWTVGVTLGQLKDTRIALLNIVRGKFSPAKTRENIVTQADLFNPAKIKVENVAYQESLRRDLADHTNLPIEGYTTGGEKFDEYVGINSVGVLFENKKIILPYNYGDDLEMKQLVDQLVFEAESFGTEGHTGDILMAFWFAIQGLRELDTAQQVITTISSGGFYSGRRS